MARIEHRRSIRRYPASDQAPARDADDLANDDAEADDRSEALAARRQAPFASLDNLSWFGWLSGGVAIGWLVINIRPLFHAGVFGGAEGPNDVIVLVQAIASLAALGLPAAIERGAAKARLRAPRLYLAAALLAFAEVATIVVQQVHQTFLADIDLSDPSQPVVLGYIFLSLVPVVLSVAGLVAVVLGVWRLGAPRARWLLVAAAVVTAGAYFLTYVPYLDRIFNPAEMLISGLNLLRLVVSLVLIASTAVAGVALMAGAVANLLPRAAWALAGISGSCYFLSALGRVIVGAPIPQDLLLPMSYLVFGLESAAPVFLLLSFAAGLARSADVPTPARRLIARWVRYSVA